MTAVYLLVAVLIVGGMSLLWLSGQCYGTWRRTAHRQKALERVVSEKTQLERKLDKTDQLLLSSRSELNRTRLRLENLKERTPAMGSKLQPDRADNLEGADVSTLAAVWDEPPCASSPPKPSSCPGDETKSRDALRSVIKNFGHRAFNSVGIGVVIADEAKKVAYVNPIAEKITGWPAIEAIGTDRDNVVKVAEGGEDELLVLPSFDSNSGQMQRRHIIHRNGQRLPVEHATFPVRNRHGRGAGSVSMLRDVTERRLMSLQVARQLNHDPITGLLNRQAFGTYLHRAFEGKSSPSSSRVLLYLDLDHFKLINNTCGHEAGDAMLQWVAASLREGIREQDVVARIGGDEFAVLLVGCSETEAQTVAEELQRKLRAFSFTWNDKAFDVSVSIGLIPFTPEIIDVDQLFCAADHACFLAKERGGNAILVYRQGDADVQRRSIDMDHAASMKTNLQDGRFKLFGQIIRPLHESDSQDAVHCEVLLRSLDDRGRIQPPGDVIRAAERYGGMLYLDRWVVRRTLQILKECPPHVVARLHHCSINLSGSSLKSDSLLEFIQQQLADSGVPPSKICFEITETAAIEDITKTLWVIEGLSAMGCQFALDDFGTGLASYGYIKDFPVSHLKIDGTFVRGIGSNPINRAIVESIHQIGHFLGIKTTAEAVGSRSVFEELRSIGVDYAQGFWVGRPAPFTEIIGAAPSAVHIMGRLGEESAVASRQPSPEKKGTSPMWAEAKR